MKNKSEILQALQDKDVFIWGARMTGLGAYRLITSKNINVIGFIDSDDAFDSKKIYNIPVIHPSQLHKLIETKPRKNLAILVAVSLKEEEILVEFETLGFFDLPIYSFQDDKSPYYTIDILSSCNLKCASCPHSIEEHDVPKGLMTYDNFIKVFDKIINQTPSLSHISLYSWGEPLLHPRIGDIVSYIHEHNVAVALSSNLSIQFEKRIEDLIKKSPDYLKVSLSGYYPTAYNKTHQGGNINLVKSNLYRLRYLIDKFKSNTVVDINYHLYRDNSGENLQKFQELADELGFLLSKTYALVMPLERVISYFDGKPDVQTIELEQNLLVKIDEGVEASSKVPLPKDSCPFRDNQVNINADLTVPVCCTVFERGKNVVAENFLYSTPESISIEKSKAQICNRCMALNLPEYNMGFNRVGWEEYAAQKTITDKGRAT
jgi:organic radical activating enzyme